MATPSSWFASEIQQMMYSCGDCRKPLMETVAMVEDIVHQQIVAMIYQANEIAISRGEKQIGIEDFLFLLRKDKVKLKRLLKYYEMRDLKNVVKSSLSGGDATAVDTAVLQFQDKVAFDKKLLSKNRQTCYHFLSSIDETGELVALFSDSEIDTVKHERMLRAELQTQGMDTQQYLEFCHARQANFIRSNNKSRFHEWLQSKLSPDVVISSTVLELLNYLAYETVAQIVDLALLVKQDIRAVPGDYLAKTRPPLCVNYPEMYANSIYNKPDSLNSDQTPSNDVNGQAQMKAVGAANTHLAAGTAQNKANKKKRKKSELPSSVEASWDTTILPSDVLEAMRRYYTDVTPFSSQMKMNSYCSPWHKPLCK